MTATGIFSTIGCIVGIIGIVIGVIGYFAGQRKQSSEDAANRARFEGEVCAKIDQVLHSIEKLENKLSKNTDALYAEIDDKIAEHERRYHNV